MEKLEAKLSVCTNDNVNIKNLLDIGINNLLRLDYIYENAAILRKGKSLVRYFPEKLHFENSSLRTGRVNEAVKYIYLINSN